MHLSALTFDRQFALFARKVSSQDGAAFASFREGLPSRWESYKELVREEAMRRLDVRSWTGSMVGRGLILERTIAAIEIDGDVVRNNLVEWDLRRGPDGRMHRDLIAAKDDPTRGRAFETWLFNFFTGRTTEEAAFEELCGLAGKKYALIAYLFFLKDWNQFAPIRTTVFDEAFESLGIPLRTTRRCSWENYREYNTALHAIVDALRHVAGVHDARLIDAHSFCWMLMRLPEEESAPEVEVPIPVGIGQLNAAGDRIAVPGDDDFPVVTDEDFAQREAARRRSGRLAQDIALRSERQRLERSGRSDLAQQVEPVWHQPGRGYDIRSFELDGTPRPIEVKAVKRFEPTLSFYVSANEWRRSRELGNYHFYFVAEAESLRPIVRVARAEQVPESCLIAQNFMAVLKPA